MALASHQVIRIVRSFVRREGRLTNGQKQILSKSPYCIDLKGDRSDLLNQLEITHEQHPISTWDLDALFGRVNTQRTLEIGFGNGESLATMAQNEPARDFLGVEVHRPGVGHLLLELEKQNITNVRASGTDVVVLIKNYFKPKSFDCIQIFFPDPWHKKRHHKRRLIQNSFLEHIHPILQTNGIFHCATDWEPYAIEIMDILSKSPLFQNLHAEYAPRPDNRPLTKFESRGQRLGHGVWDIIFRAI